MAQSIVGIDIGGTSVKLGLIEHGQSFRVVAQSSIPTQSGDAPERFVYRIAEAVHAMLANAGASQVAGVGVGCPGLIDPWAGLVRSSANLPNIPQFPLRDRLAELLSLPVEIQNDANAAVLGEWLFSPASRGLRNMCLLTMGTGVGGGVICDGRLLLGGENAGTELGHMKVEYTNPAKCACLSAGCIEAYAGAAGIARLAAEALAGGTRSILKPGALTTHDIAEAANQGDSLARSVLHQVGIYLGRGIDHLIETFSPDKVVIGGGASAAFDFFYPGIQEALRDCGSYAFTRDRCRIERSAFPDNINIVGAAAVYLNGRPAR